MSPPDKVAPGFVRAYHLTSFDHAISSIGLRRLRESAGDDECCLVHQTGQHSGHIRVEYSARLAVK
jgi:hypothetical protein